MFWIGLLYQDYYTERYSQVLTYLQKKFAGDKHSLRATIVLYWQTFVNRRQIDLY